MLLPPIRLCLSSIYLSIHQALSCTASLYQHAARRIAIWEAVAQIIIDFYTLSVPLGPHFFLLPSKRWANWFLSHKKLIHANIKISAAANISWLAYHNVLHLQVQIFCKKWHYRPSTCSWSKNKKVLFYPRVLWVSTGRLFSIRTLILAQTQCSMTGGSFLTRRWASLLLGGRLQ